MLMDMLLLLLTLAVATAGSAIFIRLRIPAGGLLGAMLFVALLNVFTGKVFFPEQLRPVVQVFAGALIGVKMQKSDIIQMKTIVFPAVLLVFGMLILNLSLGFGIHLLTGLEISTALLGSAPGGIQDMILIADDLGANTAQITVLHVVRVFAVIGVMPSIIRLLGKKRAHPGVNADTPAAPAASAAACAESGGGRAFIYLRTFLFAAVGGFLVSRTPVPAGAMIGALFGTVFATLAARATAVPPQLLFLLQIGAGALIGSGIGPDELKSVAAIAVPALLLVVTLLAANIVFGFLIHKITKLELLTCLFASSAGGLADMAIVADEMGADAPKVVMLQFARLVCVVTLFPSIFKICL